MQSSKYKWRIVKEEKEQILVCKGIDKGEQLLRLPYDSLCVLHS